LKEENFVFVIVDMVLSVIFICYPVCNYVDYGKGLLIALFPKYGLFWPLILGSSANLSLVPPLLPIGCESFAPHYLK